MALWPIIPRLDRRVIVTGTYNGGTGLTSWTTPFNAATLNLIVLSDSFLFDTGRFITPASASGTTVTAVGDYSAGPVMIGRTFTMSAELSQLFRRDFNGNADLTSKLTIRSVDIEHRNSGNYQIRNKLNLRADRVKSLRTEGDGAIEAVGKLRQWAPGRADQTRIIIEATSHLPVNIAGVEMLVDVNPLMG